MNVSVLEIFIENTESDEFEGKRVIEVGSKYVNGSVRPLIEKFLKPKEYIGVDLEKGKFVDVVLDAEKLVDYFGKESFDVVVSTELLEHVVSWHSVINNMKEILKKDGYIYITTRSKGFPYHAYPYDFWRYEVDDMKKIFEDFEIIKLESDIETPGVFLKAKKPNSYSKQADLSNINLYSMVLGKRTQKIVTNFSFSRKCKISFHNLLHTIKNRIAKITLLK